MTNGKPVPISTTGTGATLTVKADARFENLAFDAIITVGSSPAQSQMLLFSPKSTGTATATTTTTSVSPRPFQPRVQTQTSEASAAPGTTITDAVHLDVAPGDGLLSEWGVYKSGTSAAPVPVTIRSSLLGPFAVQPSEAAEWPSAAPTVCEVSVVATNGPGDYTTPECTLPSGGYYVWVETIDPADTPVDKGRDHVRSWRSPFAAATEVTRSSVTPSVSTVVSPPNGDADAVAPGDCVTDELTVDDLGSAGLPAVDVESILVGPFAEAPLDGHDYSADDFDRLPIAGRATTSVDRDGTYRAPCITVNQPGHYVFVFRSEGSDPDASGGQVIAPFADLVAHRSEMLRVPAPVTPPEKPNVPRVPPAPHHPQAPSKPVQPQALAYTGASGVEPTVLAGFGALSVGLAAVLGTVLTRVVRRRLAVRSSRSEQP